MKLILGGLAVLVLAVAPSAQAATRPDLRVPALAPATVAAGASVVFTTTVRNAGRGRAGRSVVRVLPASGTRRSVLARANVRALARGRRVRVSVRVTLPTTAGSLQVCADDLRKVRETRETNNCRAVRVTASAPPPAGAVAPAPAAPIAAGEEPAAPAPAASS
ncbi:MAG TPA: CARDB domain-containing protein, partial [Solirubrobacter sp.]